MSKSANNNLEGGDRRRLGRGLSALIGQPVPVVPRPAREGSLAAPESPEVGGVEAGSVEVKLRAGDGGVRDDESGADGAGGVTYLAVDSIDPSPFQPRRLFNAAQLEELARSIRSAGLVQPVLVRSGSKEGRWELIAGERRLRASKIAGLEVIPCVVREASDEQAAEWAFIENLQRADLSAMERANGMKALADRSGLGHAELGERLGIDRSSVANLIRLTELEPQIQALLASGELTVGHGKVLLRMPVCIDRLSIAEGAAMMQWGVRELEYAVTRLLRGDSIVHVLRGDYEGDDPLERPGEPMGKSGGGGGSRGPRVKSGILSERELQVQDLEKRVSEHLGTKVRISTRGKSENGSLHIAFYGLDHFEGLLERMGCGGSREG